MKFKTAYTAKTFPKKRTMNNQPSLTVPDQTMSIKEIMNRFAKGLPIEGQKVPVYHGEEDYLPDYKSLDLTERQELLEHTKQTIKNLKSHLTTPSASAKDENISKSPKEPTSEAR